jgi:ribosomal protein L11 methyltransferase
VNGIPEEQLKVLTGNLIDDQQIKDAVGYDCYDLVVSNILAEVIIPLQKEVPPHLKKGGIYITSGIINMKEEAVREALAANDAFEILETNYQKDWVSIVCKKK